MRAEEKVDKVGECACVSRINPLRLGKSKSKELILRRIGGFGLTIYSVFSVTSGK